MGLDTFAAREPDRPLSRRDRLAFRRAKIDLAGGMYSGDHGSFRGKLYDDLVTCITGISLYERWIPPETVREMAEAFDRCDPEEAARDCQETSSYQHPPEQILQLRAFFRVCAKRGLGLFGWS
jgi:hypothetical protein